MKKIATDAILAFMPWTITFLFFLNLALLVGCGMDKSYIIETENEQAMIIISPMCTGVVNHVGEYTIVACRDFDFKRNKNASEYYDFNYSEPGRIYEMIPTDEFDELLEDAIREGYIEEIRTTDS